MRELNGLWFQELCTETGRGFVNDRLALSDWAGPGKSRRGLETAEQDMQNFLP